MTTKAKPSSNAWAAIIAIDPGLSGAVALLSSQGGFLRVAPMPAAVKKSGRREVDVEALHELLTGFATIAGVEWPGPIFCLIERVSAMPGQGVSGMFSLGDSFGTVRALAPLVAEQVGFVSATVWKKALGLNADKRYSLACARKRFPAARDHLKLAKHEGLAEALLLAYYGHSRYEW